MQEHEVKLAVRKTSSNWQKKNHYTKPQQIITALGQVSNQNIQSTFPCQSSYDSSHCFRTPLCYKWIDLSGHSAQTQNCCVPALVKCKAVITKTKHEQSKSQITSHHPSGESSVSQHVLALWVRALCDGRNSQHLLVSWCCLLRNQQH